MSVKLVGAWIAGCMAVQAAAEADYLNREILREAGLAKFWQLQLPLDPRERLRDVYLVDDQLYAATDEGYVFAVHAHTGVIRWMKKVSDRARRVRRPCHADNRTVFLSDVLMTQFDRLTGDGVLRAGLANLAGSAPTSDGARVYYGSVNQRFYAMDVESGYEVWKVGTNGRITGRPVVWQGYLYVVSHDTGVYACQAADKRQHWVARTTGVNSADPAIDENGLYVASEDHSLYLFDLGFGQIRWRARFSGPLYEPPILAGDVAYQYCPDDGLVAVNTGTVDVEQRFRWKLPRGRTLLTVDGQHAFVWTLDQTVAVVDLATGRVVRTIPAGGFSIPVPSPGDGALYLADEAGRIFCARARSVPFPRQEELREALAGRPRAEEEAPAAAVERGEPGATIDALQSRRRGVPLGGRSAVTRSFEKGGAANP